MRHPLRRMALQGAWYAAGTALVKLSGLILLPVLTNSAYLPVADYGLWGVLEISIQIAAAVLGLSLSVGLIRFYPEPEGGARAIAAAWWPTILMAALAGGIGVSLTALLAPAGTAPLYRLLSVYLVFEICLAIPLALLRAREQAGRHTALQLIKLGLLVALALKFLVGGRAGLTGLAQALAWSSGAALALALLLAQEPALLRPRLPRAMVRAVVRFSAPLVLGGLGSLVLNAGDRYVLAALRPPEDLACYNLATRFGGVVNMLAVQPLNLAWMPLLFRLREDQRPEILRLLLPYLSIVLGAVVVGVSVFAAPVLDLMGSDPAYRRGLPLIPWIGLGFGAFGLAVVTTGVLALFHRTRTISTWIVIGALFNLALNFALVPRLGATGSAIATLVSYTALVWAHFRMIGPLVPNRYPWGRIAGIALVTAAASFAGALKPYAPTLADWGIRLALPAGWALALLAARWFTMAEAREIWGVLRGRGPAVRP